LKDGKRGDYEHFAKLIAPLRDAGLPLHLTMGNHDDRAVFYDVLKSEKPDSPAVESKHVGVVNLAGANSVPARFAEGNDGDTGIAR
jgi:Icc protein